MAKSLESLDKKLNDRASATRKTYIIHELHKVGIYQTPDGRKLEDCRLFTLEPVYINEKCKQAKGYGDSL